MSLSARNLQLAWVIVPACALGFLIWSDRGRVGRVDAVSALQGRAREVDAKDAASPTGYADGQRELIVPEASESSQAWIEQTQQMIAQGELRVRHVGYENAPEGHDVNAASPYRWWLGLVAWIHHEGTGSPMGLSVERAALYADPAIHLLLVACAAALVGWRFGGYWPPRSSRSGCRPCFRSHPDFSPGCPTRAACRMRALWEASCCCWREWALARAPPGGSCSRASSAGWAYGSASGCRYR